MLHDHEIVRSASCGRPRRQAATIRTGAPWDNLPPQSLATHFYVLHARRQRTSPLATSVILGVGHELTKISRPGVAYGPRAIREASHMVAWSGERYSGDAEGSTYVDIVAKRAYRFKRRGIYDLGDVAVGPDLDINRDRIRTAVGDIARAGALRMVLGGGPRSHQPRQQPASPTPTRGPLPSSVAGHAHGPRRRRPGILAASMAGPIFGA